MREERLENPETGNCTFSTHSCLGSYHSQTFLSKCHFSLFKTKPVLFKWQKCISNTSRVSLNILNPLDLALWASYPEWETRWFGWTRAGAVWAEQKCLASLEVLWPGNLKCAWIQILAICSLLSRGWVGVWGAETQHSGCDTRLLKLLSPQHLPMRWNGTLYMQSEFVRPKQ